MGITERREREKEEIRRKILDAARELFMTEGYDKVTMRRVADAIEYSPTTIYHHFEDKDDLVEALCHEDFAKLLEALDPAQMPADPIERLRQLGLAYARFALQNPNQYRFMFLTPREEHPHPEDSPGYQSFGVVRQMVADAKAAGQLRDDDVDAMAQTLWACVHGAVCLVTTFRPEQFPCVPPAPDLVERTVDASIRGLLKE